MFDNDLSTQNTYLDSESNLLEEVMDEPISELDSSSENELHAFDDVSSDNLLDFSSEYVASSDWDASQFDGWGDPIADASYWQQQEGQNSCAVVAQISVYEAIAGVNISEAQACQIAEVNGWFDSEAGTSPEHVGKILNALGIPTEVAYLTVR